MMKGKTFFFLSMTAIALASSLLTAGALVGWAQSRAAATSTPTAVGTLTDDEAAARGFFTRASLSPDAVANTDFTRAAEATVDGVVSIKSFASPRRMRGGSPFGGIDPFLEFFGFGIPRGREEAPDSNDESRQQQTGLGSGVIIAEDGYIVTNNHVIDGADRLEVTLNDNRSFNATVIGTDESTDLALIRIEATGLPVIPMGDSDALKVGEWVIAVGNPFGFTSTVTTGIVSAKARSISAYTHSRRQNNMGIESYIQTDAAVNPGNSGGALVNLAGELVGINTAIYSNTGSYSGYSFAIPVSLVKKVVADIRQFGAVQRPLLGVTIRDLDANLAKEKGITAVSNGVYIQAVGDRSSAAEAGIREGDVIIDINGHPVANQAQLIEQVNRYSPGDKITVRFIRDNKEHNVNVTLLNHRGDTTVTRATSVTDLGCAFRAVNSEMKQQLRISYGVQVADLGDGPIKQAGIKDGFIILSINQTRVASPEDVEKIYNAVVKNAEDRVLFITGIYPTGKKGHFAVDLN